jgi:hypothetical protein
MPLRETGSDIVQAGSTDRRTRREPDRRRRSDRRHGPRDRAERRSRNGCPDQAEQEQPASEDPHRPGQVLSDGHDHRHRLRDADARKAGSVRGAEDRGSERRPVAGGEACRAEPEQRAERERRDGLRGDDEPDARERYHDEDERPEPEQVGEEPPDRSSAGSNIDLAANLYFAR